MPNGTDVLWALTILTGYTKENISMCPEHDEIWIGYDITPEKLLPSDVKRLEELGFHWDDGGPAWHGFVSC